jgi:predicted nicotinamide N-methyase
MSLPNGLRFVITTSRGEPEPGDLYGIFFQGEYDFLNVKGRTVVDIGAGTGDSAVFFAWKGASQVIGYEPVPEFFSIATKNVELNGLGNIIALHNKAAGQSVWEDGRRVSHSSEMNPWNRAAIPKGDVLKLDCEGCEYDLILNHPSELADFEAIAIEYHRHGPEDLMRCLRSLGFEVTLTTPGRRSGKLLARRFKQLNNR